MGIALFDNLDMIIHGGQKWTVITKIDKCGNMFLDGKYDDDFEYDYDEVEEVFGQ